MASGTALGGRAKKVHVSRPINLAILKRCSGHKSNSKTVDLVDFEQPQLCNQVRFGGGGALFYGRKLR